ncbi:MAG: hypothetical protein AB1531_01120 [Chloroflexota bacterium]
MTTIIVIFRLLSIFTHFQWSRPSARIHPLAVTLGESGSAFNHDFFHATPNRLADYLPADESLLASLRLLKVDDYRPGHALALIMNDEVGKAVAFR